MPADFLHVSHMEGFEQPPVEGVNLAPRPPGEKEALQDQPAKQSDDKQPEQVATTQQQPEQVAAQQQPSPDAATPAGQEG